MSQTNPDNETAGEAIGVSQHAWLAPAGGNGNGPSPTAGGETSDLPQGTAVLGGASERDPTEMDVHTERGEPLLPTDGDPQGSGELSAYGWHPNQPNAMGENTKQRLRFQDETQEGGRPKSLEFSLSALERLDEEHADDGKEDKGAIVPAGEQGEGSAEGAGDGGNPEDAMRVVNFVPGQIFGQYYQARDCTAGEDVQYVPDGVARKYIERVMGDMQKMKSEHLKIVAQIQAQFEIMDRKTKEHYKQQLEEGKKKVASKVKIYRDQYKAAVAEQKRVEEDCQARVQSLQERMEKLDEELMKRCGDYEEELKRANEKRAEETEKRDAQAARREGQLQSANAALLQLRTDVSEELAAILEATKGLRKTVTGLSATRLKHQMSTENLADVDLENAIEWSDHPEPADATSANGPASADASSPAEGKEKEEGGEEKEGGAGAPAAAAGDGAEGAAGEGGGAAGAVARFSSSVDRTLCQREVKACLDGMLDEVAAKQEAMKQKDAQQGVVKKQEEEIKALKKKLEKKGEGVSVPAEYQKQFALQQTIRKMQEELKQAKEKAKKEQENEQKEKTPEAPEGEKAEGQETPEEGGETPAAPAAGESPKSTPASKAAAVVATKEEELRKTQLELLAEMQRTLFIPLGLSAGGGGKAEEDADDSEKDEDEEEDEELKAQIEAYKKKREQEEQKRKEEKEALEKAEAEAAQKQDELEEGLKMMMPAQDFMAERARNMEEQIETLKAANTKLKDELKKAYAREDELSKKMKTMHEDLEDALDAEDLTDKHKLNASSKSAFDSTLSVKKLQEKVKRLEKQLAEERRKSKGAVVGAISVGGGDAPGDWKDKEKEYKRKIAELEKGAKGKAKPGAGDKTERKLEKTQEKLEKTEKELEEMKKENKKLIREKEATEKEMKELKNNVGALQASANEMKDLKEETRKLRAENAVLEKQYKDEKFLRKKYYNEIEDMKGKIRVYCRVRPMAKYEIEKGSQKVVDIVDEFSLKVHSQKGAKDFMFDRSFGSDSTQEEIFEDTRRLVQSAIDGFNVCIFAYGQTGSGKTFTIQGGGKGMEGLTPRAITELFQLLASMDQSKFETGVECYMCELYNNKLFDLLLEKKQKANAPALEIKKDATGMVRINGITVQKCEDAVKLSELFAWGLDARHTGSTAMNATSSRSHLIFSMLITVEDKTAQKRVCGKLSFIDLAGSERASKTNATKERLAEAREINKSLSALGDVISALSSGESFVPYRNHLLTQLMSDSLGGTAKTLMFVNVSPADYNCDETVTSLAYASRVKMITNDATKNVESKEVAKLRSQVNKLMDELDAVKKGKAPKGGDAPPPQDDGKNYDEPPDLDA